MTDVDVSLGITLLQAILLTVGDVQVPSFRKNVLPDDAMPIAVLAALVKSEILAEVIVGMFDADRLTMRLLLLSTSSPVPIFSPNEPLEMESPLPEGTLTPPITVVVATFSGGTYNSTAPFLYQ